MLRGTGPTELPSLVLTRLALFPPLNCMHLPKGWRVLLNLTQDRRDPTPQRPGAVDLVNDQSAELHPGAKVTHPPSTAQQTTEASCDPRLYLEAACISTQSRCTFRHRRTCAAQDRLHVSKNGEGEYDEHLLALKLHRTCVGPLKASGPLIDALPQNVWLACHAQDRELTSSTIHVRHASRATC